MSRIRVRMVPKTKEAASITVDLSEITPQTAKLFAPDRGRAATALRASFGLGIAGKMTRNFSIDSKVPQENFKQIFAADLVDRPRPASEHNVKSSAAATHVSSDRELAVPDSLKDTIAFAYIPTPPEFFATTAVAPKVSLYHLSLADVVAALKAGHCHRRGWTGRGIRVVMADSGFAAHPYFDRHGYNITRVHTPETEHPMIDGSGHGTGESANVLAVAPDVHLIGVKHDDYSAMALETSLEQKPHISTHSWGWDVDVHSKDDLKHDNPNLFNELRDVESIVNDAIDDGVVMIFSAGNGHHAFPGSMPHVISAGGTTVNADESLEASSYASSFASQLYPGRQVPDFCGVVGEFRDPGPMKGHIMLPVPDGSKREGDNMPANKSKKGWGIFSGTSAAAPQLAGVAALLLSADPDLTPEQIKSILASTAIDVTRGTTALGDAAAPGHDAATGAGFVDARAAALLAERLRQQDAPAG